MADEGFSDRLRSLRKQNNLTLEQLAEKIGSTKSYIWSLENKPGIRPSAQLVNELAKVLGVTVEYMLGEYASEEDQVFFRDYKGLDPKTKKDIRNILDALKKGK